MCERVAVGIAVPARDRDDQEEKRGDGDQPERDETRRAVGAADSAGDQREAEHEQQVADHRAGERAAHDLGQALVNGDERDDQLRRVPEGRVQEAADARPRVLGCVLGRLSDQPRERNQRQRGEHEFERRIEVRDVVQQDDDRSERKQCVEDATDHGRVPYPRGLPEDRPFVKSCGAMRERTQSRRGTVRAGTDRASAPTSGRGGVPPVRGALRQGRLPRGVHRALVPVRLRVRGLGAHVRRLHAARLRGRDRSRPAAGGGGPAGGIRRDPRDRARRCRCARSRSRPATSRARTRSAAGTRSSTRFRARGRASA